jgi:hypothetical protein
MGYFDSTLLYNALNVTAITSLIDTGGLFDSRAIAEDFEGFKTINFYLSGPYNGSVEWSEYQYSVNCRAQTDGESRAIAEAVFNQLNRADFVGYHTNCNVLGTLPPIDSTDVFNTPVEVILKSRL